MRVAFPDAKFAVVGWELSVEGDRCAGVLYWHDNELDAHREAKRVILSGGAARVVLAPGGDLQKDARKEVRELVFQFCGNIDQGA